MDTPSVEVVDPSPALDDSKPEIEPVEGRPASESPSGDRYVDAEDASLEELRQLVAEDEAEYAAKEAAGKVDEGDQRRATQVPYESTELGRIVADGRADSPNPLTMKNAAVFEYQSDGATAISDVGFSRNPGMHAERNIWADLAKQGVQPSQVTRIYTELEPCSIPTPSAGCAAWIERTFPQAEVTFSYEYGATSESRSAGNQIRAQEFRERFGEEVS